MITALSGLFSELRTDLLSSKLIPALSSGLTSGLGIVVAQIAFGSLIFFGPLESFSTQGIGLILFGNFAACLLMALTSNYRGIIAGLSPALVVIMASIASTIDAPEEQLYITTVCALMFGAVASGLCCLMIGHFRLARLVRFIPYSVAAGFLAGIGGKVCLAALTLMGAQGLGWTASLTLDSAQFWIIVPGIIFGVLIYYSLKRWGNVLILPVGATMIIIAYHIVLSHLGFSSQEARQLDLLLTSTAGGQLWPSFLPPDFLDVEWRAFLPQIPRLLTLILIALICVILGIAGLELAVNKEIDWNVEFKATGYATLFAGTFGGTVSSTILSGSVRSKLLGAETRLVGITASIVMGSVLVFGDKILEILPTALIGGILIFSGIALVSQGLLQNYKRLPSAEFGVILVISLTIIFAGLVEGVIAGMVIMLVFFAVRLSRVDPIEDQFTVRERRGNKARTVPDRAILLRDGDRVKIYRLRGYIFFGSIGMLMSQLKTTLKEDPKPLCLMLDFSGVAGLDFSATSELSRFLQRATESEVIFILSGVSEQLQSAFQRVLPPKIYSKLRFEANENQALEQCEDAVLTVWKNNLEVSPGRRTSLLDHAMDDLESHLERQIHFEDLMEDLREWLTPQSYVANESISIGHDLQLLISGRASVYHQSGKRLQQFSPGDAIRSISTSENDSASVVADTACQTLIMTVDTQNWLEENRMDVTLKLYRYLLNDHLGRQAQVT